MSASWLSVCFLSNMRGSLNWECGRVQDTHTHTHTYGFTSVKNETLTPRLSGTKTHVTQEQTPPTQKIKSYYDHSKFIPGERQTKQKQSLWPVLSCYLWYVHMIVEGIWYTSSINRKSSPAQWVVGSTRFERYDGGCTGWELVVVTCRE